MTESERLCEAVDRFAEAMKAKLLEKLGCRWDGWDTRKFIESGECKESLRSHAACLCELDEPEEVDVANFCMFLWHYREKHLTEIRT